MKNRQQMLLLAAAIIVGLYFGGEWLYREYIEGPETNRNNAIGRTNTEIKKTLETKATAKKLIDRLDDWKQESLPGKIDVAQASYRSWLLDRATTAGLLAPSVEAGSVTSRKGQFQVLSFSLRGKGRLETVTRFLYDFYQTKLLHQIQSLSLTPLGKTGELDVSMSVHAVSIPETPNWEAPPKTDPTRLAQTTWEAYQVIGRRNVFGFGGSSDLADRTVLTAVTAVDGLPEVWFTGESDKLFKFKPGDEIEFGRFHGKLAAVLQEDVILESSGERWLLSIGENFGQALPLPPENR